MDRSVTGGSTSPGLSFVFALWRQEHYVSLADLVNRGMSISMADKMNCQNFFFLISVLHRELLRMTRTETNILYLMNQGEYTYCYTPIL